MRIHCITLVKNESDVIEQTLLSALSWCDNIFVLDNGSTDGTWEKVNELAKVDDRVFPWKQDDSPFRDSLRDDVLNEFRSRANREDWWCRLDADEFYIDDPRTILARVKRWYDGVFSSSYQYYFTDVDLAIYTDDHTSYSACVPLHDRIRFYRNNWGELRFFRHKTDGSWCETKAIYEAIVWHRRIRLRHYQYRSPAQMMRRLETRRRHMPTTGLVHETRTVAELLSGTWSVPDADQAMSLAESLTWKDRVVPAGELDFDHGGELVARPLQRPPFRKGFPLRGLRNLLSSR